MSQQIDADFLVYLLEMAAMEASDVTNGKTSHARKPYKVVERPKVPDAEELAQLYMSGAYD